MVVAKRIVAELNPKKVLFIAGTRPEVIKLAPIIKMVSQDRTNFKPIVAVTAQHREMLDQALRVFDIKPDYDLDIMRPNQSLGKLSAFVLQGLSDVMRETTPDFVLVQGDTTTTFIASLAAYYSKVRVAHVEAGLRTSNKFQPFPEEMYRRLVSVIADLHFAPTERARSNLLAEGVSKKRIFITGNTGIDALLDVTSRKCKNMGLKLKKIYRDPARLVMVTVHRRESVGLPLVRILKALKEIAKREPGVNILFPVHLNPNVQNSVRRIIGDVDNIYLVYPLDYCLFSHFMKRSYLILTDSGGVQEEGPALGKPVLAMREVTERREAVEAGAVKLVGTNTKDIVDETLRLLHEGKEYAKMAIKRQPFGDGRAASRIVSILQKSSKFK